MQFKAKKPAREFEVGFETKRVICDCGSMHLEPDEQITFVTDSGGQYDVTRKDWGFYMAPSLNGRLASFQLRPVLVKNRVDRYFALLVERGKEAEFERYLSEESLRIIRWLDTTESLQSLDEQPR